MRISAWSADVSSSDLVAGHRRAPEARADSCPVDLLVRAARARNYAPRMDQTQPHTAATLAADLKALGVVPGDVLMVHSSMKSLGFVAGGAQAVVEALLSAVGPEGTVVDRKSTRLNSSH